MTYYHHPFILKVGYLKGEDDRKELRICGPGGPVNPRQPAGAGRLRGENREMLIQYCFCTELKKTRKVSETFRV